MPSHAFSPIMRRSAVVASLIASTVACSDEATSPRQTPRVPPGISAVDNPDLVKIASFSPRVDGWIGRGEYSGAATLKFMATIPSVNNMVKTPVTMYVTHDQTYLYIATVYDRKGEFHPFDRISFDFDLDNDGMREDGDDYISTGANIPQYVQSPGYDMYRYNGGNIARMDDLDGGTIDPIAARGVVGTVGVFEIRHPLNGTDDAHDMSINPWIFPKTIGMGVGVQIEGGEVGSRLFAHTYHPSYAHYCKLTIGASTVNLTCP